MHSTNSNPYWTNSNPYWSSTTWFQKTNFRAHCSTKKTKSSSSIRLDPIHRIHRIRRYPLYSDGR